MKNAVGKRTNQWAARRFVTVAVALLASASGSITANGQEAAAAQNGTPASSAAARLIDALGASSDAARLSFIREALSSRALANESAEARAALLKSLAEESKGFEIVSVSPQGDRLVEVIAKSKRGGRFGRFVVFTSSLEPGKIANFFILPARDPAVAARDAWPEEKLASSEVASEIEKRIQTLVAEDVFSGAVLVARRDQVLLRGGYGLAEHGWRKPVRSDTTFQIASIGKMFTSVAVLKLVEQGKLSLDDTLRDRVPEYPHREAASKITLRHLLTHTAGLGDWEGRAHRPMTGREAATTMTAEPAAAPGERFNYSNAGYVLLQAAVENVTKRSFEAALQELVFTPAGMTRTGLWPVTAITPNQATGYLRPATDPLGFGPRYSNVQFLGYAGNGSGGAYSNVDDLFRFHRALVGKKLLGAESTRAAIAEQVTFPGTPRASHYGYGVRLTSCGGRPVFGHSGGGPNSGVSNATYATTDGEWTVIVLSNYDPPAGEDLALSICDFLARQ